MSSTIIYHLVAAKLPKATTGYLDDFFVVLAQMGGSRDYEGAGCNSRRARDWKGLECGTYDQVMDSTIASAADCSNSSVKMKHAQGDVLPEQYITTIRNLLNKAQEIDLINGEQLEYRREVVSFEFFRNANPDPLGPLDKRFFLTNTREAIHALFANADFMAKTQTTRPYAYLKAKGPRL